MKRTVALVTGLAALAWVLSISNAVAADNDKEVTIKGEAKCAHCALNEGDKCQTVIQAEKEGKKENYYLADNEVSKAFHHNVCKETKNVVAKGVVTKVDGKNQLKASKIEITKKAT